MRYVVHQSEPGTIGLPAELSNRLGRPADAVVESFDGGILIQEMHSTAPGDGGGPPVDLAAPLRIDNTGTVRVGRTRMTLETVIGAFHDGWPPERIARQYPALRVAEIYG